MRPPLPVPFPGPDPADGRPGSRAEIDLQVLLSNPGLWLRLEEDISTARARGTLRHGAADIERLGRHIDTETTRALGASGLGRALRPRPV